MTPHTYQMNQIINLLRHTLTRLEWIESATERMAKNMDNITEGFTVIVDKEVEIS